MALELNLTKNTNDSLQGTFGKYYPRVEYKGTIGTLELAKHMSAHTTSFSKGEINGMLTDLVDCIRELCLMGYVVKIEDLGLFKCSVEGNGLTLKQGARVSAGMGVQRTDEELTADITKQQSAYSAVKIIMQATGETTIEKMNRDAKTSFSSSRVSRAIALKSPKDHLPKAADQAPKVKKPLPRPLPKKGGEGMSEKLRIKH